MNTAMLSLTAALILSCGGACAAGASVSGTAVINGKTITTFSQGRAWKEGDLAGQPYIKLLIAEKSLDGLDVMAMQDDFSTGKRGSVFEISPSPAPMNGRPPQAPYKYLIDEDYKISLWSSDFGNKVGDTWNGVPLSKDLTTDEIKVDNGWVEGALEWKGEKTQMQISGDHEDKITAYKLTFKLPLEEAYPGSKK